MTPIPAWNINYVHDIYVCIQTNFTLHTSIYVNLNVSTFLTAKKFSKTTSHQQFLRIMLNVFLRLVNN